MDQVSALAVILSAIQDYNDQVAPGRRIQATPEARLFGRGGLLDSLGLVNLILLVEERLQEEHQVTLTLADERAMSQEKSPFSSVQRLAEYVCLLSNDSEHG